MSKQPDAFDYAAGLHARGFFAEANELLRQKELIRQLRDALLDAIVIFGPEDGEEHIAPKWEERARAALDAPKEQQ